jgi:hypothetical protein
VTANSNPPAVRKVLAFKDRYLFLQANQANGADRFAPIRSNQQQWQIGNATVRRLGRLYYVSE